MYRTVEAKNGKIMYYNGSKLCSKAEYLANQMVATEEPVEAQLPQSCIFCRGYAKRKRFINLKTVNLCEDHYFGKTPGEVANKIDEMLKEDVRA